MSKRTFVNTNLLLVMILLLAIAGPTVGQRVRTSNQLTQQTKTDAADVIFRSGRDLITDQEWAKAQEKFNQLISTYPNTRT